LDGLFSNETEYEEANEEILDEETPQNFDEYTQEDFSQQDVEEEDDIEAEEPQDILEELASDTELDEMISGETFGYQESSLDELFGDDEEMDTEEASEEPSDEDIQFGSIDELEDDTEQEDEFVQSEFAIDDDKGFYLVDFEDTTALVGHIGEEIFILKRFGEKVYGQIHARLNEHKGNAASFMVKIDDFRALIEVTPENMNLLIEL